MGMGMGIKRRQRLYAPCASLAERKSKQHKHIEGITHDEVGLESVTVTGAHEPKRQQDVEQDVQAKDLQQHVDVCVSVESEEEEAEEFDAVTQNLINVYHNFRRTSKTRIVPLLQSVVPAALQHDCNETEDPLIGRAARILWPMDEAWYLARISGKTRKGTIVNYSVQYEDGSEEVLNLSKEEIKLELFALEAPTLLSKCDHNSEVESLEDGLVQQGDVVWARMKGYPPWPALVITSEEALSSSNLKLSGRLDKDCIFFRFFGTYEFGATTRPINKEGVKARSKPYELFSFVEGAKLGFHHKWKRVAFKRAVAEAETYLKSNELPDGFIPFYNDSSFEDEDEVVDLKITGKDETFRVGRSLKISNLGIIEFEDLRFHDSSFIYPIGFVSERTVKNANGEEECVTCRIIRKDEDFGGGPLFNVSLRNGDSFAESTAQKAWNCLYEIGFRRQTFSGHRLFGYSLPTVQHAIHSLPNIEFLENYIPPDEELAAELKKRRQAEGEEKQMQVMRARERWSAIAQSPNGLGFKPVHVSQAANRCAVCNSLEETDENQFLQCDSCSTLVHMGCYGVDRIPDGSSWKCSVCSLFDEKLPLTRRPACCLCPNVSNFSAMKPTTDGRWAHICCAIWTPETTLLPDMGRIDKVHKIRPARLKLKCGVCNFEGNKNSGPCVQCSVKTCFNAAHVLCARNAGWDMLISEENNEVKLSAFCLMHSKNKRIRDNSLESKLEEIQVQERMPKSDESSIKCARERPYKGSRHKYEVEDVKIVRVQNQSVASIPYVVSGARNRSLDFGAKFLPMHTKDLEMISAPSSKRLEWARISSRRRIVAGRSSIHGWGVFSRNNINSGDFVVEYCGEVLRSSVANLREERHYVNSVIGFGTYIFKMDDKNVVDASTVGNIAQLINHSCEPNCFSRVLSCEGQLRIMICALHDIKSGEELTYDYRFSGDEILKCNCGTLSCRGTVNINILKSEEKHSVVQ